MMKSFVREREDQIRIGFAVVLASVIVIAGKVVGEIAYLPLVLAGAALLISELWRWRRERAKARSDEARSTGSR
jgi:hypothetical protein